MGDGYTTVDPIKSFAIRVSNTGQSLMQGDDYGVSRVEARTYVINNNLQCTRSV